LDYEPVPNSPHDLLHEFAWRYNRALPRLIFPLRLPDFPLQHVAPLLNQALGTSWGQGKGVCGCGGVWGKREESLGTGKESVWVWGCVGGKRKS
jgi:hypothetical protein